MKTKLTQHDILSLHLAEINNWVPSYALSKVQTAYGWVGSSGERRMRELAEDGTYEHKGIVYTIERRKLGKYTEYRVLSKAKPRTVYVEKHNADGSISRVPQLIA